MEININYSNLVMLSTLLIAKCFPFSDQAQFPKDNSNYNCASRGKYTLFGPIFGSDMTSLCCFLHRGVVKLEQLFFLHRT